MGRRLSGGEDGQARYRLCVDYRMGTIRAIFQPGYDPIAQAASGFMSLNGSAEGTGRAIPLTRRACAALTLWLSRSPQASSNSFVFPAYRIGGKRPAFPP